MGEGSVEQGRVVLVKTPQDIAHEALAYQPRAIGDGIAVAILFQSAHLTVVEQDTDGVCPFFLGLTVCLSPFHSELYGCFYAYREQIAPDGIAVVAPVHGFRYPNPCALPCHIRTKQQRGLAVDGVMPPDIHAGV